MAGRAFDAYGARAVLVPGSIAFVLSLMLTSRESGSPSVHILKSVRCSTGGAAASYLGASTCRSNTAAGHHANPTTCKVDSGLRFFLRRVRDEEDRSLHPQFNTTPARWLC